jgi:SSS family transporter
MSTQSIYIIVLVLYFAIMFGVGIITGKKANESNDDYFLAKDKLPASVIGFSFSATQMSGSTYMGAIGTRRSIGIPYVPCGVSSASAPWFSYILVGDRIRKLNARVECLTMADIFEKRFGKAAGLIAAIIILFCNIPLITGQFQASGGAFQTILGLPYVPSLIIFGGIVVVYTIVGGMFAVAWTDLIQGALMILGFLILAPMTVIKAGGFANIFHNYAAFNPQGISFGNSNQTLMWMISGFLVWGFFQIGGSPAAITRFLTTTDDKKMKDALAFSVMFQCIIYLSGSIIALGSVTLIPELAKADMVIPELCVQYLPPVIGAVVITAALAAMMSTVDSVILMCSSIFVVNILEKGFKIKNDSKVAMIWSKVIVVLAGLSGLLLAINPPDSILWIITTGFSVMAAAFTFPLLAALWWPRCSDIGGVVGMVGGALSAVLWYVLSFLQYGNLKTFVGGWWPAIVGSIVSLILVVYVSLFTAPSANDTLELFYD